ncbi:MAG: hypothetical protein CL674_01615 [Bdellovibrionaceae bacterium]|nr:hypothetical protein [Pseudobdellovibrionaceae bacterium]|tara:strand:+ start:29154 stop:29618 length:465 start_codon:yes stop_codon:yes gene_type:complete
MKKILLFFIIGFLFMGCSKPDPAPELRDPIYQDISKKLKAQEAKVKELTKEVEQNKENLKFIEPYTRQSKDFWQKYWTSSKNLKKAEQLLHYYNLHLINRKYAAKNSYIRAWNNGYGDEWPSATTMYRYELNQRLKNAPRKWDSEKIAQQINEK